MGLVAPTDGRRSTSPILSKQPINQPNLISKSVNIYRNHVISYSVQREKAKYGVIMVIHMMR